jgi:hypothetical protein
LFFVTRASGEVIKRRSLNPPAASDPVVFGPSSVFAHIISFVSPRVLCLRTVLEMDTLTHMLPHTACTSLQTPHAQVSSKWREALVVALHILHPEKCLVFLIGRPGHINIFSHPLYTITNAMLYEAVDSIHAGQ